MSIPSLPFQIQIQIFIMRNSSISRFVRQIIMKQVLFLSEIIPQLIQFRTVFFCKLDNKYEFLFFFWH